MSAMGVLKWSYLVSLHGANEVKLVISTILQPRHYTICVLFSNE